MTTPGKIWVHDIEYFNLEYLHRVLWYLADTNGSIENIRALERVIDLLKPKPKPKLLLKDTQWLKVRRDRFTGLLTFSLFERFENKLFCYKQSFITIIGTPLFLDFILYQMHEKLAALIQNNSHTEVLAVIDHERIKKQQS